MKKVILFAALFAFAVGASAQDYRASIGANVGTFYGASFKGFITNNLAIQADLGVNLTRTHGGIDVHYNGQSSHVGSGEMDFYTFEANPNVLYQAQITSFSAGTLSWFAGGGLSLGFLNGFNHSDPTFKMGFNGMGGVELKLAAAPLALSFDFRPGYGMGIDSEGGATAVTSFLDWKIAIGVRYIL